MSCEGDSDDGNDGEALHALIVIRFARWWLAWHAYKDAMNFWVAKRTEKVAVMIGESMAVQAWVVMVHTGVRSESEAGWWAGPDCACRPPAARQFSMFYLSKLSVCFFL